MRWDVWCVCESNGPECETLWHLSGTCWVRAGVWGGASCATGRAGSRPCRSAVADAPITIVRPKGQCVGFVQGCHALSRCSVIGWHVCCTDSDFYRTSVALKSESKDFSVIPRCPPAQLQTAHPREYVWHKAMHVWCVEWSCAAAHFYSVLSPSSFGAAHLPSSKLLVQGASSMFKG